MQRLSIKPSSHNRTGCHTSRQPPTPRAIPGNTFEQEQALFYQLQNRLVALKYRPGTARAAHYADLEDRALDVADRLVENIKACVLAGRRDRKLQLQHYHHHHDSHRDTLRRWEELNRMCRELAAEAGRLKVEAGRVHAVGSNRGVLLCSGARAPRSRMGAKELQVPSAFVEEG
ncbi:hypothetical protein Daus18300_001054 [Diaporthe australafricana]|uniref:Uncharacterized protein n=1 Tax=Diaporthe australafricana TaxID=127596 RepID=A0ABR3Y046_9PEZI